MGLKKSRTDGIERLDTNILIRLIARDNPKMTKRAEKLIARKDKFYIFEDAAMMEVVFVLTGKYYNYSRKEAAESIKTAIAIDNIGCNKSIIEGALDVYVSHPKLSFVDCYLAVVADTTKETPLWTFDRKLIAQCPFAKEP